MTETRQDPELSAFYADLAGYDLQPLWLLENDIMSAAPRPAAVPWLWRWKRLRELAERAGELIPIERGGDRRVLSLANPGLAGRPYATPTLWGAVQYLGPHESAPAHRHTAGAVRFVLEGEGVWSVVDGDPCPMAPGDLVLTPNWTWHEHHNPHDRPMAWFDGLDLPLASYLDSIFFELHPDGTQDPAHPTPPRGRSQRRYAAPGLLPVGDRPPTMHSPLLVYRWAQTDAALADLLADEGGPLASLRFTDPTSGRDALPTLRCEIHRVAGRTPPVRTTGSAVYVVFRGTGSSVIGGQRFDWEPGDMFTVPSWVPVEHAASQADIFCISDAPVLAALGLFRRAVLDRPQDVHSVF